MTDRSDVVKDAFVTRTFAEGSHHEWRVHGAQGSPSVDIGGRSPRPALAGVAGPAPGRRSRRRRPGLATSPTRAGPRTPTSARAPTSAPRQRVARLRIASAAGQFTYLGSSYDYASWTSPTVATGFPATEAIASWTADTPGATWVQVEMRGVTAAGNTSAWKVDGPMGRGRHERAAHVRARADRHRRRHRDRHLDRGRGSGS